MAFSLHFHCFQVSIVPRGEGLKNHRLYLARRRKHVPSIPTASQNVAMFLAYSLSFLFKLVADLSHDANKRSGKWLMALGWGYFWIPDFRNLEGHPDQGPSTNFLRVVEVRDGRVHRNGAMFSRRWFKISEICASKRTSARPQWYLPKAHATVRVFSSVRKVRVPREVA